MSEIIDINTRKPMEYRDDTWHFSEWYAYVNKALEGDRNTINEIIKNYNNVLDPLIATVESLQKKVWYWEEKEAKRKAILKGLWNGFLDAYLLRFLWRKK